MQMQVVLRRKGFEVEKEEVEELLRNTSIEEDPQATYYVVIGERELPAKKALGKVLEAKETGLTLLDFTTRDAVRIFRRLGFKIVKKGKESILKFAGAIKAGGNAVEDKRKLYESSP